MTAKEKRMQTLAEELKAWKARERGIIYSECSGNLRMNAMHNHSTPEIVNSCKMLEKIQAEGKPRHLPSFA